MTEKEIVQNVSKQIVWWVGERKKKFTELSHDSMASNPFLLPLLCDIHGFSDFESLADFTLGGHFSTGHATGFGKLVDEKILPNVFGTKKLNSSLRRNHPVLRQSCFDEIDHVVKHADGKLDLLSLKAGRWTIQLTMAVKLNNTFEEIIRLRQEGKIKFSKIVVGVFYGNQEGLTDKYDILRGINRGANHTVVNLTDHVDVHAGKEFWSWLNNGEEQTQHWVLSGILDGMKKAKQVHGDLKPLIEAYRQSFINHNRAFVRADDKSIDWDSLLKSING